MEENGQKKSPKVGLRFFFNSPLSPNTFWAWCVVLFSKSRIDSYIKKKFGPNSKGKSCPSLIYSNVGLLLADVGLGLFPTHPLTPNTSWA